MQSLGKIKDSTERTETFVKWLVDIIRDRNWIKLTILLVIILIVCFNPGSLKTALPLLGLDEIQLPDWYTTVFWLAVVLIFFVALIIAFLSKPKEIVEVFDPSVRSAVKGLRSFSQSDAELFGKLQRNVELKECLNAITDIDFRLGILVAESGTGKTSFLQAGVLPMLPKWNDSHQAIYIKLTDQDPMDTIRKAIQKEIDLTPSVLNGIEFNELLEVASNETSKTLVLLFDQFEQFLVHYPRIEQRRPFINAMAQWYKKQKDIPIKILFSLRSDFMNGLIEFQKAMGYSLGPQDIIELKKFTSSQATQIFEVIAENTGLEFDPNFVAETVTQELANREDGLISPVDIQILAWIIQAQKDEDISGFNKNSYQKLGGVEGLLDRFLQRTLSRIYPESRRESMVKAMLSLIDLKQNVRVGILTEQEIIEKLNGAQNADQIKRDLKFLAGKARLLTEINREGQAGYELAHERLIPAIRRITGEVLSDVEKANQLLEQRVNEWLGNDKSIRFLLRLREYLFINKFKSYLDWRKKKELKEELLGKSKRLFIKLGGFLGGFLILIMLIPLWLQSTPGQIFMIRWNLDDLIRNSLYGSGEIYSIMSQYIVVEEYNSAKAIADKIDINNDRLNAYVTIAEAAAEVGQADIAISLIEDAIEAAARIKDAYDRSSAYRALAEAAAGAGNWELAQTTADQIEGAFDRSEAYWALAAVAVEAGNWELAQTIVAQIEVAFYTNTFGSQAYRVFAEAAAGAGNWELAQTTAAQILNASDQSWAYRALAEAAAEAGQVDLAISLIEDAIEAAARIVNASYQSATYRTLAEAAAGAGQADIAISLIEDAIEAAARIEDAYDRSSAYRALAEAAAGAGNWELAQTIVAQIEDTSFSTHRPDAFRAIAEAAAGAGNWELAQTIVAQIEDAFYKSVAYSAIAETAAESGNWELAQTIVARIEIDLFISESYRAIAEAAAGAGNWELVQAIAVQFEIAYVRSEVFRAIAEVAAGTGNWELAQTIVARNEDASDQSWAYKVLAEAAAGVGQADLSKSFMEDANEAAARIEDAYDRSSAYRALAEAAAGTGNWELVFEIIRGLNLNNFDKAMASIYILNIWDNRNNNSSDGASENEDLTVIYSSDN